MNMTDQQWADFGREFYEVFRRGGFGRLPKREIDTLVFHLLEIHANLGHKSETVLAQELASTPQRIRGFRKDARYLYWDDHARVAEVRRVVFGAIANEAYQAQGADQIAILIADGFVREFVVDLIERNHLLHDTSFNRGLLKLDRKGIALLTENLLTEEHRRVLTDDPATKNLLGTNGLQAKLVNVFKRGAKTLALELANDQVKELAKWMLLVSVNSLPALLT